MNGSNSRQIRMERERDRQTEEVILRRRRSERGILTHEIGTYKWMNII